MLREPITSVRNPLIQALRALKDKPARTAQGLFLVEGEVLMREALLCGLTPASMLLEQSRAEAFDALISQMAAHGAAIYPVTRAVLEAVCDTRTPQGACGAFKLPGHTAPEAMGTLLLALDGVQDPGNVGTIWRTADAAGFHGLLLGAGCADPLSPKVQRAAMGSGFRVPFALCDDLALTLSSLRGEGYAVIASTLDGTPFFERAALPERAVLVIGSEAHGICAAVDVQATCRLKLPMHGGAESLNAAVAAGIMMYDIARTR